MPDTDLETRLRHLLVEQGNKVEEEDARLSGPRLRGLAVERGHTRRRTSVQALAAAAAVVVIAIAPQVLKGPEHGTPPSAPAGGGDPSPSVQQPRPHPVSAKATPRPRHVTASSTSVPTRASVGVPPRPVTARTAPPRVSATGRSPSRRDGTKSRLSASNPAPSATPERPRA
jgi:hypothetical protein